MKDNRNALIHDLQAGYLEGLERPRDELLAEMEREAQAHQRPISDPEVATFLAVTIAATGARRIVEVGTNIGYGAIVMARAAGEEGRVLTIEKSPELCGIARGYIRRAGLEARVEVEEGSAIEVLERLSGTWDLAYIDCVKEEYPRYLELLTPRLARGGVVVADNVLWRGLVASEEVPEKERERVEGLRAFNRAVVAPPFRGVVLALGDGVAYAVKTS